MQASMVTTALELPGYRVTRNIGIVRGIVVRSRSLVGNIAGGLQSLFGGNIKPLRANAHGIVSDDVRTG